MRILILRTTTSFATLPTETRYAHHGVVLLSYPGLYLKMIEVPIDLAQGGKNQGTFFEKMQNVILTDEYLKTAIKEYQEFLALRKVCIDCEC